MDAVRPGLAVLLLTACSAPAAPTGISLDDAVPPRAGAAWEVAPAIDAVTPEEALWAPMRLVGLVDLGDDGVVEFSDGRRFDVTTGGLVTARAGSEPRALVARPVREPSDDLDDRLRVSPPELEIGPWRVTRDGRRAHRADIGATITVAGEIVAITEDGRHLAAIAPATRALVFVRDGTATYRVLAGINPRRSDFNLERADTVIVSPSGTYAAWLGRAGLGALDLDRGIVYGADPLRLARAEAAR